MGWRNTALAASEDVTLAAGTLRAELTSRERTGHDPDPMFVAYLAAKLLNESSLILCEVDDGCGIPGKALDLTHAERNVLVDLSVIATDLITRFEQAAAEDGDSHPITRYPKPFNR